MVLGQREVLPSLLPAGGGGLQRPQAWPFSVDNLEAAQFSDEDVESVASFFFDKEIQAILAAQRPTILQPGAPRSRSRQTGEKRKSPPWPTCVEDDDEEAELPLPPPPPAKRARTKCRPPPPPPAKRARTSRRQDAGLSRQQLREWHHMIAARILVARRPRAPEPSWGRTALRHHALQAVIAGWRGFSAARRSVNDVIFYSVTNIPIKSHHRRRGGPGEAGDVQELIVHLVDR